VKLCGAVLIKSVSLKYLYTLNEVYSRKAGVHNHSIDENVLLRQKISNSVKRKAKEDISERLSKPIHREMSANKNCLDVLTNKDVHLISQTINYTRLQSVPKLPKSSREPQDILDKTKITTT
jgi:hypothetical protein